MATTFSSSQSALLEEVFHDWEASDERLRTEIRAETAFLRAIGVYVRKARLRLLQERERRETEAMRIARGELGDADERASRARWSREEAFCAAEEEWVYFQLAARKLRVDRIEARRHIAYMRWHAMDQLLTRGQEVPLGAKDGASVLPLMRNGPVAGSILTSAIKGRELFIPRYRKEFGCT
jgi:hypothetical protein